MIRSLVQYTRFYRNLLATSTNFSFHSDNQIATSSVILNKIENNDLNPITEESNSLDQEPMVNYLRGKLNCSKEWADKFVHSKSLATDVGKSLELLLTNGVRTKIILDNPKMLTLKECQLSRNLMIVKDMQPVDINDFAPLVQVATSKLLKLKQLAQKEVNIVPKRHRIYYISEAMDIEPCIVAQFISKRPFILQFPFESFDQILQLLLKYVAPIDILHDLWAFNYKPDVIEQRFERARRGHIKKMKPWIIRCTEEKFSKSIKLNGDMNAIAGDETNVKYLADRLKYDVKKTTGIMQKYPEVYKVRVTKMKEMLDLLFDAGFTPLDISQCPKILCHSVSTTEKRLDELKSMGCRPLNLSIICKSASEYNKFVQNWIGVHDRINKKNEIKE